MNGVFFPILKLPLCPYRSVKVVHHPVIAGSVSLLLFHLVVGYPILVPDACVLSRVKNIFLLMLEIVPGVEEYLFFLPVILGITIKCHFSHMISVSNVGRG